MAGGGVRWIDSMDGWLVTPELRDLIGGSKQLRHHTRAREGVQQTLARALHRVAGRGVRGIWSLRDHELQKLDESRAHDWDGQREAKLLLEQDCQRVQADHGGVVFERWEMA